MTPSQEILGIRHKDNLNFFYTELRETKPAQDLSNLETEYVASVLAHFAECSIQGSSLHDTVPGNLTEIFDLFVLPLAEIKDVETLHLAAGQCLFILGFFSVQMKRRHNLDWFTALGRAYYVRAGYYSSDRTEQKVFYRMSKNFAQWVASCQELQANCRDSRFLIHVPPEAQH